MRVNNPILTGFNPDPSIIRVEDTYYIATSTFETYPGISIYESKDLVNFKLVARPLTENIINMRGNSPSSGVWAPDITYKDGMFYIVFSNMKTWCRGPFKDTNNFIICSSSIKGPWSKPVYINSSGFDASLFHDDDNKSYFVNMEWDFRQGRGDVCFTGILVQEIDLKTFSLIGNPTKVFKGTDRGFVEGPHIYKKSGYYYLFCAEGGTDYNHAESVCRSKNVYGPYEVHPDKLILTAKDMNCTLQRAGHASLVDGLENGWFLAHLCSRPLEGKYSNLGRETALQNLIWENDWPYLVGGQAPRDYYEIKSDIEKIDYDKDVLYDKIDEKFKLDFQTLRTSMKDFIKYDNDKVILEGHESVNSMHDQVTLQRRQSHPNASFEVKLNYSPTSFQHMAGIMYRYQEGDLYFLYATYDEKLGKVIRLFTENDYLVNYYNDIIIPFSEDVFFKVEVNNENVDFYYSFNGLDFVKVGPTLDARLISDEVAKCGGFTGAFFAIHACDMDLHKKEAIFSQLRYRNLD